MAFVFLTKPYFCGQSPLCMDLSSAVGLQRAKQRIEKCFPLVGTLEKLNGTLALMEKLYPERWFKGIKNFYHSRHPGKCYFVLAEHIYLGGTFPTDKALIRK